MFDALRTRLSSRLLIPGVLALVCGSVVSLPAQAASELPVAPAAPAVGAAAGTDQIIVKFKAKAAPGSAMRAQAFGKVAQIAGAPAKDLRATSAGARVLRTERALNPGEIEKALAALRADPAVEYAEPDHRMHRAAAPNDPYYSGVWGPEQWGLGEENSGMRMEGAWTVSKGAGAVVAVVDTGITSHSDLNGNVLPGYDMMSDPDYSRDSDGRDANPRDEGDWTAANECQDGLPASDSSWHGTQVAGIIAAVGNNAQGMIGVAPEAKILPVRALGPCGGYTSDIADGIIWAAGKTVEVEEGEEEIPVNPNPARVINLSLGGVSPRCSVTFQNAVNVAYNSGAVVVAAAGNDKILAAETSPSNCENVVSVAALARTGQLAPYSNYGSAVDVAAPGGDMTAMTHNLPDGIVVTFNAGSEVPGSEDYAFSEGTSMAAPHASGLAALLMSRLGDLATPANVETRMETTSRKYAWACQPPKTCGSGVLDGTAALNFKNDREITGSTPIIQGTAVVGNSLYAQTGSWIPSDVSFSYQWHRNGTPIQGAQGAGYDVQPADVGASLTATVKGSRFFGTSVSETSAPTPPVEPGALVVPNDPLINGQAIVGGLLTAYAGTWEPAPVSMSYQWYRAGAPIPAAVANTYRVSAEDKGKTLSVRATGTKDAYVSEERSSAETAVVATGVVPAPVQFTDKIGTPNDTYTVPSAEGVEYVVAGSVVAPGTYPGVGALRVDARATHGYAIVTGSVASWTVTFDSRVFSDINAGSSFSKEITWLATEGITSGWLEADGSRTFRSSQPVNRDQMAAFLFRLAGSPAEFVPPAKSPFADVPTSHNFYKEISWLAKMEISGGWGEADGSKTFRPGTPVNRDQMAAFIYRHAGKPEYVPPAVSPFADIPTNHGFYKEIAWLAKMEISGGWGEADGSKTFRPGSAVLRDQMAAFMYRYRHPKT
ncbi:S8 family serine peptidase [Arthrobacter sp. R1-13]